MKAVWIAIAVLVAAALVVWLQPPRNARVDPQATRDVEEAIDAAVESTMAAAPAPAADADAVARPQPASGDADALVADLSTDRAEALGAGAEAAPAPQASPIESTPIDFTEGLARPIKHATVTPGQFGRTDDGDLVADGRWVIRGSGTADDPYSISWDLLTSAMESFQPRLGTSTMPQRVAMLDGAHVTIEGFFAFPIVSNEVKQGIVTLNRWDGCCIGIPPTPYDAIEMTLAAPKEIRRGQHQILFGEATGILRVEPYLLDGWLVGIYLLDDASIRFEL